MDNMKQYPFIFSKKRKYRLPRHLLFWASWWLFQSFLYGYSPAMMTLSTGQRFTLSSVDAFFFLAPHIFMAYTLMYFVIPRYIIRGMYVMSALAVVVICFLTGLISSLITVYLLDPLHICYFEQFFNSPVRYRKSGIWFSLMAGLRGGITIGGLAAAIKLMKHWYVKEQRNLQLQKENVESQLQLLKAQVHPHFLFNTLNNIYSYTQNTSVVASTLVMGLSDMLRYMLYECDHPLVPLAKELKMIGNYITLEKIRYDDILELHADMPEDVKDLHIAPLLLLPFVENCFKHGTSRTVEHPWLNLQITVKENMMTMKLLNGKPPGGVREHVPGIGISNVRKRLELLYPGRFELIINNEEDVFIVNLKLELESREIPITPVSQPTRVMASA